MRRSIIKINPKQKRGERIRKTRGENWRKFSKGFTIAENIGAKVSEIAQEPVKTFHSIDHANDIARS